MALITLDFPSIYLSGDTQVSVILPDCPESISEYPAVQPKHRVLWLLHGGKGDCTDWVRKSRIEIYANRYQFAVVMPSCYNTMYMDWLTYADGYRINPFLFEELMPMIYHWFPVSDAREDNFLAGLGGGGVATFKYAMTRPTLFSAAAALSTSPRDYDRMFANGVEPYPKFVRAVKNCGSVESFLSSEEHIKQRLLEAKEKGALKDFPPLLAITGENDHEIDQFRDFMDFSKPLELPITYRIEPGFRHDWEFWDYAIQEAFRFFAQRQDRGNSGADYETVKRERTKNGTT